jgi:insecticidal toxin complex protein TccC
MPTHSGTGEVLQVISVQAGRSTIRVLHWEQAPSRAMVSDQYRYNLNDHLGSCTLELDSAGEVISQEGYHPFGTTAWFAGRGEVEAIYKTVRYSGKERDATGLYYYGFRYYVPWLQRWLNPDPAGDVDGPNFYRMVRNNPLSYIDEHGQVPKNLNTAQGIHEAYKDFYSSIDRVLPFQIMKEVTQDKLNFKTGKASANMLEKAKAKRFTLRHYSSHPGMKGAEPPFVSIESNFSLVSQNKMTLGGKTGNTSEKDWTKAGNSAFTFFLLAVDGEVSDRGFLKNKTHFAEYDVADDEAMHEALGPDFANIEFFASSDVLDPKHARLETVPAVKGKLADLKALLLASAAISPVQLGRMESRVLLGALDQAFAGSLEVKLPGSVNVKQWHEKMTT